MQRRITPILATAFATIVLLCAGCQHVPEEAKPSLSLTDEPLDETLLAELDERLGGLVQDRAMVGMSAAIVRRGKPVWSKGYGFADLEEGVAATPDTPYRLGGCSEALAAVLLMKLVEEGVVGLDDRLVDYRLHSWYPGAVAQESRYSGDVLIRHVLSNSAQGTPGHGYRYAPSIFVDLTWVVEEGSGLPYPSALVEYITGPANMGRTVPGQLAPGYDTVLAELAKPYDAGTDSPLVAAYRVLGLKRLLEGLRDKPIEPVELDPALEESRREVLGAAYTPLYGVNASRGVISSVVDLVKFDRALDEGELLSDAGRNMMWTSAKTPSGESLPQGLGWFVQDYHGKKVVWQFGDSAPSVSALYIKVLDNATTFIALANTDRLCAGYDMAAGDVTASPFGKLFLDAVIGGTDPAPQIADEQPRAGARGRSRSRLAR
ncbi:MAG: hypothetical protein AMXMBFR82_10970 [Candidatus Hydrogenedentota bacterium]